MSILDRADFHNYKTLFKLTKEEGGIRVSLASPSTDPHHREEAVHLADVHENPPPIALFHFVLFFN